MNKFIWLKSLTVHEDNSVWHLKRLLFSRPVKANITYENKSYPWVAEVTLLDSQDIKYLKFPKNMQSSLRTAIVHNVQYSGKDIAKDDIAYSILDIMKQKASNIK